MVDKNPETEADTASGGPADQPDEESEFGGSKDGPPTTDANGAPQENPSG